MWTSPNKKNDISLRLLHAVVNGVCLKPNIMAQALGAPVRQRVSQQNTLQALIEAPAPLGTSAAVAATARG